MKGFVAAKRPWTSARSGTFAFRQVPLERAGAIALRLESGSLSVAGVPCRLLDDEPQRPARDSARRKTLQAGRTDEGGRVRFDDVPPGRLAVRIQPGGRFGFDEGVDVESGRTTEKTVALERISVSGNVMRAGEPIPAARVQIRLQSSAGLRMNGAPVPVPFLRQHLSALGLASATDGTGRIDLVALAPSLVEVFAARASSFASVALGQTGGLLTTRALQPGERADEIVTLRVVSRVGP